jgi:hypothetical protein
MDVKSPGKRLLSCKGSEPRMLGFAILILFILIGITCLGVLSTILSIFRFIPAWCLALAVLPSFLVGTFYTIGLAIAQRGSILTFGFFGLNMLLGIVCYVRLLTRSPK